MLVKFSVKNFKSFKDTAEFNTIAINSYKEKNSYLISPKIQPLKDVSLLPLCAIYGTNASGKTSFIEALDYLKTNMLKSIDKDLFYVPFSLDKSTYNKPTEFNISFICKDKVLYEYNLSHDFKNILHESLYSFPKGYKRHLFTREKIADKYSIKGSEYFPIPKMVEKMTNPHSSLVSIISTLDNTTSTKTAKFIIEWFKDCLDICYANTEISRYPYSGEIIDGTRGTDFQRNYIKNMVRNYDLGICDVTVKKVPVIDTDGKKVIDKKNVFFKHSSSDCSTEFNFFDESEGTKQIFTLSGHIARALEEGSVLIIDEIESSLHPLIIEEIVNSFLNKNINTNNAQIIFTSHNINLLDKKLLRRDQIWVTNKDSEGESELYAISDFSPRQEDSILRKYLMGKYKGIPVIKSVLDSVSGECNESI